MSFSTIISEYSSSRKSAPLMTWRGSSSCPLVKKARACATRSGVRARPSRSGSGSMARRSARTCCSRSFADIRQALTEALPRRKARSAGDHALAAQVLEDGARRGRAVEGVEVDPWRARAQQLGALPRRPLHTHRHRGLLVVAHALERAAEPRRHLVPGERRDALDLRPGGDRHDARDERQRDAGAPGALDEAEVVRVVVEELRDHHVEARVHLHLEVLDAALAVAALRMPLGMPAPDQAEIVAARADEADHVERVAKAVRRRTEAGILRAVAA